jgi:hypothetical protein
MRETTNTVRCNIKTETRHTQEQHTNAGLVVGGQNKVVSTEGARHAGQAALATVLDADDIAVHGGSSCTPLCSSDY